MFKIVKIIIFFLYINLNFSNSYSNEKLIHELKEGEKIVADLESGKITFPDPIRG